MLNKLRSKRALGLLGVLLACGLAATGAQAQADHLLLTKVIVKTRVTPQIGSEYVAIHNPTAAVADLSQYYLTDATLAGAPYWELVMGGDQGGGGANGDFNARFPDGAMLGAGETIVVSFAGSTHYLEVFGVLPDYELFEDGLVLDDVPELVEARPGGIAYGLGNPAGNTPPSTGWLDDSETLVLYLWDGTTDLVQDIDYLTWGASAPRVDKSAVTIDGPDADTATSAYLPDTPVGSQDPMTVHEFSEANERVDDEEGTEILSGGNGREGHDETSENLSATWAVTLTMAPPAGGATTLAAPVITAAAPATQPQYENEAVTIAITVLSPPANAADEMSVYWRADGGAWQGVGAGPPRRAPRGPPHPPPPPPTVVDWWVEVGGEEGGTDTWPNAAPFYTEQYTVLPPVDPGDGPAHLLLTEVCVSGSDHEFVEIFNPTDEAVDLSDYYLTDAIYNEQGYWRLPEGNPSQTTVGGGDYYDFQARFPDGAMIQPGEVLVLSLAGSDAFNTVWGLMPDLDLRTDMREVFSGSLHNVDGTNATLSNTAEIIVLYYWDGVSDLVTDIDMFFWGSSTSARVDKTGYTIGSSTYANDTPVGSQDEFSASHDIGGSFQRLDDDETGEPTSGGNGPAGHDETGEPLNTTWFPTTGTPGVHGGSVLNITNVTRTPGAPEPDDTVEVTATIVAQETITSVDLHYRTDGGVFSDLAMSDNFDGTWSATIPGFALDTLVEYYVDAADDLGGTAVWPAGAPGSLAGYTVSDPPDPGDYPPHLLLTEVCVQGSDHEFIEVFNPTDEAVDLSNYYLTDAVYNDQGYWRLPEGNPSQSTVGGGDYFDFQSRFPAGAMIQPGEALTVSLAGSDAFSGVWAVDPDFEMREDGGLPDAIPDMREVFAGSLHNPDGTNATLTNGAEIAVLYYWDGVTDLVTDIDMFFWGSSTSARVDKSGYSIGGSTYASDTPIASQDEFTATHEILGSFQRLDRNETGETASGGNGSLGHDETSEPLNTTWEPADGTPGAYDVSALVISGVTRTPNIPEPDQTVEVTATIVAQETVTGVGLHYRTDGGVFNDLAMSDNFDGTWSATIPGFAIDTLVEYYVDAADDQGGTAVWPAGAPGTLESYTVQIIIVGEGLARLLLTEIATLGTTAEFIEIHNPNDFEVPLANYYLTDAVYYEDQAYWNLPRGNPSQATIGGGDFSDFHAKFPDEAVLPAGETITVSVPGSSSFGEVFPGLLPHYEFFEDDGFADNVADLEEVFPGSINGSGAPTLTNLSDAGEYINGEIVVLYFWDGISDLVTDIDIFIWGEGNSYSVSKQGRTNGSSTYASEAVYPDPFLAEHAHLESYQRVDMDEGTEVQSGSNGFEGADETSENLSTTWAVAAADPSSQGGTGPIITGVVRDPNAPEPDQTVGITATIVSQETITGVDLYYRTDGGAFVGLAMTDNFDDTWSATVPGFALDTVVEYYVDAADDQGGTTVWPAGAPSTLAGYTVSDPPDPGDYPPHLLLTEVCVQGSDHEFIEVFNPTAEAVDLSNYYLTDGCYLTGNQGYWRVPEGNPSQSTVGGGDYYDFHARFPDGAVIEPGEALTVSLGGSDVFNGVWGVAPDLDLRTDMRELFSGSLHNADGTNATLSNSAEIVVLYYWDGASDLVTDIDVFFWGSSESARVNKTGYTIGISTYAPDTPVANQDEFNAAHEILGSFQRLDRNESGEITSGGNGSLGHDETSEPLNTTWQAADGTPGVYEVIDLAIAGATLSPARPQPGEEATVTVSVVGMVEVASVTLRYAVDGDDYQDVACTENGKGPWSGVIPGQAEDAVVTWYVNVAGAGGESAVWPEGAPGTVEEYTVEVIIPGEGLARLLLTEIATLGSTAEFIEIHNPNDFDVELKNYYLTDAVYYEDQAYWNLPRGNPSQSTIGGGDFSDFHAKFPNDAVLPAGEYITVSMPGSGAFSEIFSDAEVTKLPHFEMFEDGDSIDSVPDMVEVFPGSINGGGAPTLTNLSDTGEYINGEILALYFWDGLSDLVTDIDIFIWGEGNSYSVSKEGRTNGASTYASEAVTEDGYPDPFMTEHAHLESYTRIDFDEGTEVQSGSNGFEGADETSENLMTTWEVAAADPAFVIQPEGTAGFFLSVPARTFLPLRNERFDIVFTSKPGWETVLRIFDLEGRLVRALFDSRFDGNPSTDMEFPSVEPWDGRNDVFELVKAGMYIVHLQFMNEESGDRVEKTAPAVVATRLSN